MERLLYFLPDRPQPVYVRYGVTALIMLPAIAVLAALHLQSGFAGLFVLLPGIFVAGIAFDRGSAFLATLIGTLAALWMLPFRDAGTIALPLLLFVFIGAGTAVAAESLRKEMEKVVAQQRTKTLLLQELAHRTKNNLAMLSAMARLQARSLEPKAREALEQMSQRIQVIAEVYDHLMVRDETKLVDLKHYIAEICQRLGASISGASPVAIRHDADEVYVHSETAVPLAIIMNELVTNSLKYAFPDGRAGLICVELRADGDITMSVSDNGTGFSAQAEGGTGSRIVDLMTQQLGGTLERDGQGPGSRVTLRMPKPPT